jgi:ethanolamine utilization microcompartment shell protein EutL
MSDTINGVSRYADVTVDTSYADLDERMSRPSYLSVGFVANTSAASQYVAAPGDGKLVAVVVQGSVTSDATKTYTLTVTRGASTELLGTTLYDASPVLTAHTAAFPVLVADTTVKAGDILKVTFTGGTGSGNFSVLMVFDLVG